jgi:hypothetical protein
MLLPAWSRRRAPDIKAVLDTNTSIRGLNLLTTDGKELGKITDVLFDEKTAWSAAGAVERPVRRRHGGQPFFPLLADRVGQDVAFVAPEAGATIRSSTGGIKGAFRRTPDAESSSGQVTTDEGPSGPGPTGPGAGPLPPV